MRPYPYIRTFFGTQERWFLNGKPCGAFRHYSTRSGMVCVCLN